MTRVAGHCFRPSKDAIKGNGIGSRRARRRPVDDEAWRSMSKTGIPRCSRTHNVAFAEPPVLIGASLIESFEAKCSAELDLSR